MSMKLNFHECILARARNLQLASRDRDAAAALKRLADFRDLPSALREEVHARLGELYLKHRKHHRARKHLAIALAHGSLKPELHVQMARACERGNRLARSRAVRHYRMALELGADQPLVRADLGLLLLRLGRRKQGLELLRQAGHQAPEDPAVLARQIDGLCSAARDDEARGLARKALFGHPRDARFRAIHDRLHFEQATPAQAERTPRTEPQPQILPFSTEGRKLRADEASPLQAPHRRFRPARRTDTRHG